MLDTCGVPSLEEFSPDLPADVAVITARGGQYRLCWCATGYGDCGTLREYRSDVGELQLLGPSKNNVTGSARACGYYSN